jgi:hypothetical protein
MALYRLAVLDMPGDPASARRWIEQALGLDSPKGDAFGGRQGAMYARQLGQMARTLALAGDAPIDMAHALLAVAIREAGKADARLELGVALYLLGDCFERGPSFKRLTALAAAWACYDRADDVLRDVEGGADVPAQQALEQRIRPQWDLQGQAAVARAVALDPWRMIDDALAPRRLDWRP